VTPDDNYVNILNDIQTFFDSSCSNNFGFVVNETQNWKKSEDKRHLYIYNWIVILYFFILMVNEVSSYA